MKGTCVDVTNALGMRTNIVHLCKKPIWLRGAVRNKIISKEVNVERISDLRILHESFVGLHVGCSLIY